ncbi:hypothetical protein HPB47_026718 [Ixodes persulcatus]|uniref:Uncharacterized protein n=1 Tax=Ixodes persulcatus TaxID=34615 RepID=A0AC60PZD9_IXOPE|nr:hypothetical protein HPB47_026718 [Ixodes persulcatus]
MSQLKTSQPAGNANESAETSNIPDEPSDSSMEDDDNEAPWNVKATKKRRHGSNSSKKTSNVSANSTLHFANTPTACNVDSGDNDVSPFTLRKMEDERGIWLVFSPDMPFPAHLLLD